MEFVKNDLEVLFHDVVVKIAVSGHTNVIYGQVDFYLTVIQVQEFSTGFHVGADIVVVPQAYFDVQHFLQFFFDKALEFVLGIMGMTVYLTQNKLV